MAEETTGLRLLVQIEEFRKAERAAARADARAASAERSMGRMVQTGATAEAIRRSTQREVSSIARETTRAVPSVRRAPISRFSVPSVPTTITQTASTANVFLPGALPGVSAGLTRIAQVGTIGNLLGQAAPLIPVAVTVGLVKLVFDKLKPIIDAQHETVMQELEVKFDTLVQFQNATRQFVLNEIDRKLNAKLASRDPETRKAMEKTLRQTDAMLATAHWGEG